MDPSALESVSRSLESSLDSWGAWLTVATALVVAGLLIEYWHPFWDFFEQWRRPAAAFPWKMLMELAGGILVTVGVAGELYATYRASRIETNLRENNRKIEAVLNLEAKEASDRAEQAKKETEDERLARVKLEEGFMWRRLSKAQQSALAISVSKFPEVAGDIRYAPDSESNSFAIDIAQGLRDGGWRHLYSPQLEISSPVATLGPIKPIVNGVTIITTDDLISVGAAKALQDELQSFGYTVNPLEIVPARPYDKPPQIGVSIKVYARPEGLQGEAKLRHDVEIKKKSQSKKR